MWILCKNNSHLLRSSNLEYHSVLFQSDDHYPKNVTTKFRTQLQRLFALLSVGDCDVRIAAARCADNNCNGLGSRGMLLTWFNYDYSKTFEDNAVLNRCRCKESRRISFNLFGDRRWTFRPALCKLGTAYYWYFFRWSITRLFGDSRTLLIFGI